MLVRTSKISGLVIRVYFVPFLFEQSQTTEMAPHLPRLHFLPQRHQRPSRPENCIIHSDVAVRSLQVVYYDP